MSRCIFVTGIGVISPAGGNRETTWHSLLAGELHVGPVQGVDLRGCSTDFAAQVTDFPEPKNEYPGDRVCRLALIAAQEAVCNADLPEDLTQVGRVAICVGTSKGGIFSFDDFFRRYRTGKNIDSSLVTPLADIPPDGPARTIARRLATKSGIHTQVSACSTGLQAVINGANLIADNRADIVIAGSADASIHPLWIAAFEKMKVLAGPHKKHGAAWACRPFDRTRNGFAIGEGAAILVLESADSTHRRGVQPWARVAGWAQGNDPAGLTRLTKDASPLAEVIRLACYRASCRPERICGHFSHGTSTIENDLYETRALARTTGRPLPIPVVSIKGSCGHLLGGAGALESSVAAMACRNGQCPPNATLLELDPRLPAFLYPRQAIDLDHGPVLKTAIGFGGHLAAIIMEPSD